MLRELRSYLAAPSRWGGGTTDIPNGRGGQDVAGRHPGLHGGPVSPDPMRQGHHMCKVDTAVRGLALT